MNTPTLEEMLAMSKDKRPDELTDVEMKLKQDPDGGHTVRWKIGDTVTFTVPRTMLASVADEHVRHLREFLYDLENEPGLSDAKGSFSDGVKDTVASVRLFLDRLDKTS